MISISQLNSQNDKITELSNVLSTLIEDRSVCDTDTTCDLFFDYTEKVIEHLDTEERDLYRFLLMNKDLEIKNTASQFLSGSTEIKRVFQQFLKRWCKNKSLHISRHDLFVKESQEMFKLVLQRITSESENLYPLARKVADEQKMAA